MPLTDYISPQVLADEGYIHRSDKAALFENIGAEYLHSRGWVDMTSLRDVPISIHKAARLLGISDQTLKSYASEGLIAADADLHFYLHDVIRFDCRAAKRRMRMKRTAVRGKFFF